MLTPDYPPAAGGIQVTAHRLATGIEGFRTLVLAPDEKSIYVAIGNQSSLTQMASSRVPLNWGEDDLLPRLPTGFMDESYAPQGYVSRMDPDVSMRMATAAPSPSSTSA